MSPPTSLALEPPTTHRTPDAITDDPIGHVHPLVDPVAELVRPIAGVSLELYVRIVKSIEIVNHDLSLLEPMAAAHGVPRDAWVVARRGWNERIGSEDAIRELFQVLYRGLGS